MFAGLFSGDQCKSTNEKCVERCYATKWELNSPQEHIWPESGVGDFMGVWLLLFGASKRGKKV